MWLGAALLDSIAPGYPFNQQTFLWDLSDMPSIMFSARDTVIWQYGKEAGDWSGKCNKMS